MSVWTDALMCAPECISIGVAVCLRRASLSMCVGVCVRERAASGHDSRFLFVFLYSVWLVLVLILFTGTAR